MDGRVNILVTNVGQSQLGDPASMKEEVWDAQMDINLKCLFSMSSCSSRDRKAGYRWLCRMYLQHGRYEIHWQAADSIQHVQSGDYAVRQGHGCHLRH